MASKSSSQKCGSQVKGEKVQETQNKIEKKLKLQWERDILRLFQDSVYSDIKLTVHSSSLLTHSCILRARASRFYKFIYSEFEVFEENGISVFNIYNASFTHLQTFVENIYTNVHTFHAEEKIIKHLRETKNKPLERSTTTTGEKASSAFTPDADLFFTPQSSPSELQKPFASSKLNISENDVASYYKITVDDIPLEEKLKEEKLLEKELAEQDELLSSFQIIFSKKAKTKPESLSVGTSSQTARKTKPKFNRKFESNYILLDDRNKSVLPHWKPVQCQRDKYSGVKNVKKSARSQEKVDLGNYVEELTNSVSSDMDVSTTTGDSGLDVSLKCQQETSPREVTMSETSGVDLTEAAINEEIPNDETISTKQSSGSSVTSEAGTWDGNDDYKVKFPSVVEPQNGDESLLGAEKRQLNEDEITRLDEMEKNMRDCEMFLYMERQASLLPGEDRPWIIHSTSSAPGSLDDVELLESRNQYAGEKRMSNTEESFQGETGHRRNSDEDDNPSNHSYSNERNSDDAINAKAKGEGVTGEAINLDYFAQPDIVRDVQEARTPPCTPKKLKTEEPEVSEVQRETKSQNWKHNNSTGVSNYFIDASSLLDEDEIISPPISLVTFKSQQNFDEPNNNSSELQYNNNNNEEEEEPKIISKKVVTNFYAPDSTNDIKSLKENERRQGDIIFMNSIPHYSKHEVEKNQVLDSTERLRGGANGFSAIEDDSEQVVPSADIDYSSRYADKREPEECGYGVQSDYYGALKTGLECESESRDDYGDKKNDVGETHSSTPECLKDVCSQSPNLRRRNESTPIFSGGMDFVEEEKVVQKKPSQSQGEAWIVTFDDENKPRNKSTENRMEDLKSGHVSGKQSRRKELTVEFYIDERSVVEAKTEPKAYPIEKSGSSGYFLDFSDDSGIETAQKPVEVRPEKKNMFSMFIGMDDNSNSTFARKGKSVLEREGAVDKSIEDTNEKSDARDDRKKPFYMFIESSSPSVKRKQMPKRPNRTNGDATESVEAPPRRNYLRTQSYTIEGNPEETRVKQEVRTDFECSSSDSSLPYSETNFKSGGPVRGRLPAPVRGDTKLTAWAETKQPTVSAPPSESWLRTNDIQVNYRGKNKDGGYLKKDSTFVRGNKYKDSKPAERDSGVILSDKGDDCFVKLSDLDCPENVRVRHQQLEDRMSRSISEERSGGAGISQSETSLSKSVGSEGGKANSKTLTDRGVNRSLSRLFPNMTAQSLARISDRGDSETSEVSTSMQSSVDPPGLDMSTSETDVSSNGGTTSKLGEDLLKMFLEEINPDIVIEVNGRRIKAHKCILSSRCQYFAAALSGGWVESAGNVISLQGFSYNAVHFALRHIYSGESRLPESLSLVELATLADMLCLDGLQQIISYNLKVKYCHSFHVPCSVCSVGVIDCLPIAAAYGLDDLYRTCLRWITKYFVKIWPTKSFGSLPRELLEKCYKHFVVHMTVDNVLDTVVNIDRVRGSLPNVRWAESVSRLVNKLHDATVRYIAEHFSSILTSDSFLALGKEAGWNVSRLEDSLIETVRYLPPEQACWSHARLHRILSVVTGPDPPPEMIWNENFLKLLQVIAELVENSLIKQAPRAAKSKAWRQMEPELRSRIQEAACLVLPDQDSGFRRSNYIKKDIGAPSIPQTAKSRNLELRQIKLAMTQQSTNRIPISSRPLSLQIDPRPKRDSRFIPLRTSVSTSSVRKPEPPTEGIRKTQSRSYILANSTVSEPKKTINPRYSEVKSRYLEPRSPLKSASEKPAADSSQRRSLRCISSSDSSRNCSPALRSSHSRSSIPQAKKTTLEASRQGRNVLKSGSMTTLETKRDRSFTSNRLEPPASKTLSRLTKDQNMSTDSLCTDSLVSEKDATVPRRPGTENAGEGRKPGRNAGTKSNSNSPVSRRHSSESWSSVATTTSKTSAARRVTPNESRSNPPPKRTAAGKIPVQGGVKSSVSAMAKKTTARKNQINTGKTDSNLVNGNSTNRKRSEVDLENNKKNLKDTTTFQPSAVERSGTFLKDEPTILKKPQVGAEA